MGFNALLLSVLQKQSAVNRCGTTHHKPLDEILYMDGIYRPYFFRKDCDVSEYTKRFNWFEVWYANSC